MYVLIRIRAAMPVPLPELVSARLWIPEVKRCPLPLPAPSGCAPRSSESLFNSFMILLSLRLSSCLRVGMLKMIMSLFYEKISDCSLEHLSSPPLHAALAARASAASAAGGGEATGSGARRLHASPAAKSGRCQIRKVPNQEGAT